MASGSSSALPAWAVDPLGARGDGAGGGGPTIATTTEEDLLQSLDHAVDTFNEALSHATSLTSARSSSRKPRDRNAQASINSSLRIAGTMELARRREMLLAHAACQGDGEGATCSDATVCADQLEEAVASAGNPARLDSLENSRKLLGRFWRYRKDEIEGQKMQLLLRWNRYCRSSDMIERTQQQFRDTMAHLADEHESMARVLRIERNGAPLPSELAVYAARQQCNEPLRRFYRVLQWMPHSNRASIVHGADALSACPGFSTMPTSSMRIEDCRTTAANVSPLALAMATSGMSNGNRYDLRT